MTANNSTLTQERLKALVDYDQITGIFTLKVYRGGRVKAGDKLGYIKTGKTQGYVYIRVNGRQYPAHHLAWLYVYGAFPTKHIDHKDHIRHHNWINNLREADYSENSKNQSMYKNNKSGITGVFWDGESNKWRAKIRVNGKSICLGRFEDLAGAAKTRKDAELKYGFHENHRKK